MNSSLQIFSNGSFLISKVEVYYSVILNNEEDDAILDHAFDHDEVDDGEEDFCYDVSQQPSSKTPFIVNFLLHRMVLTIILKDSGHINFLLHLMVLSIILKGTSADSLPYSRNGIAWIKGI